jgi:hypothetical protein
MYVVLINKMLSMRYDSFLDLILKKQLFHTDIQQEKVKTCILAVKMNAINLSPKKKKNQKLPL